MFRAPPFALRHALSMHGVNAFRFEVIEDVTGKAVMDARERHWIVELGTLWPHGYNYNLPGGSLTDNDK